MKAWVGIATSNISIMSTLTSSAAANEYRLGSGSGLPATTYLGSTTSFFTVFAMHDTGLNYINPDTPRPTVTTTTTTLAVSIIH